MNLAKAYRKRLTIANEHMINVMSMMMIMVVEMMMAAMMVMMMMPKELFVQKHFEISEPVAMSHWAPCQARNCGAHQ